MSFDQKKPNKRAEQKTVKLAVSANGFGLRTAAEVKRLQD